MEIKIKSCFKGAKEAEGTSVIIDLLRACPTITAILAKGVKYLIPVSTIEEAITLKQKNYEILLFGDQEGKIPDGFDYGNSPVQVREPELDLRGKIAVLRTSTGTQAINYAQNSDKIYIGSFSNVRAVCDRIIKENPEVVSLIAVGTGFVYPDAIDQKALEDELCAQYFKGLLLGQKPDYEFMKEEIKWKSDGADRLKRLNQGNDLKFYLKLNTYNIVPYVKKIGEMLTIRL